MRLIIVVEGPTEEDFVKESLVGHLANYGVFASATVVGKEMAYRRGHQRPGARGGGLFRHWKRDIDRILRHDSSDDLRVTTLWDLYGLPEDFPGLDKHGADPDTRRRCDALERSLANIINDRRFMPYIQRHEFEALVLASLPSLAELLDAEDDLAGLAALEAKIEGINPEDINDGKETAPSKRLLTHIPGFRKTLHGPIATGDTGLVSLRQQCPRFDAWLSALEALAT